MRRQELIQAIDSTEREMSALYDPARPVADEWYRDLRARSLNMRLRSLLAALDAEEDTL